MKNIFFDQDIESNLRFNKDMTTVYDLSYMLLDFQAVINNIAELVCDSVDEKYEVIEEKTDENHFGLIENIEEPYIYGIEHPRWQKEIENDIESLIYKKDSIVVNRNPKLLSGYKQTTNRRYNKRHQMNLKLNGFSHGSLILDLVNSLIVAIIIEFLKELTKKNTGNPNVMDLNIYNNQYIIIDGEDIRKIPQGTVLRNSIILTPGNNYNKLDVNRCVHDIVESSTPNEDIEGSIRRFLEELKRNGLVNEQVIYDERGIKTAVRDIDRFTGHFIDVRI